MDNLDPQLQERVWQRVRGEQSQPELSETVKSLAAAAWQQAAAYLMLSRQFQGKEKAQIRRLFEEEQASCACLRGAYTMLTGEPLNTRAAPPPAEAPKMTLRKCYGREMRSLARYEGISHHPEYGPVFARLAEQEREHCRVLLEILGGMGR